jgi:hypothetical protein
MVAHLCSGGPRWGMAVEFESRNPGATPEQIGALSHEVGALPSAYVAFLLRHDGFVPARNRFPVRATRVGSVREVLGCDEALRVWKRMRSELGPSLLPICEAEGGNLVCLALPDGRVLFWDHDHWGADGLTPVASSVDDFVELLRGTE